ncbi:hypothetical protein ABEX41_05515 [Bacillus tropicus]|uniref:Uncharacterized protein n=1 Tax=Bacillus tropicus TaxID=2026188 RepID=A0ABD7ZNL5_9BACI|nr:MULTISPECIES: hypothetical protein [Bacillus cereus group]EEM23834.1 hypothetical protein bthur0001_10390 [Bacillus thuringiensis serovar tochigiensis BGSC 4Y1]MEC2925704.1 hypothetical protein [Bacillus tropicus]MEC3085908.1 hypothetical protein [Bacillus tropicus]WMY14455.1 hypothetical protein P3F89_21220 [Bacillus tropicus]
MSTPIKKRRRGFLWWAFKNYCDECVPVSIEGLVPLDQSLLMSEVTVLLFV